MCAMLPLNHGYARGCSGFHRGQQRSNHIDEIKEKKYQIPGGKVGGRDRLGVWD